MMKHYRFFLLLFLLPLLACNRQEAASDAYGNFEAIEIMVSAESAGRILEFTPGEGERLIEGEIVVRIDTGRLHLQQEQLETGFSSLGSGILTLDAQLHAGKVQLDNLKREENRIHKLAEGGAATSKQEDDIRGQVAHLEAELLAIESQKSSIYAERKTLQVQIRQIEDLLDDCYIRNPIDGVLLSKYKEKGEMASPGQPLYKMAGMDELILRAYISGKQLASVELGGEVTVKYDKSGILEETRGRVSWISPSAEFTPKIIQTRDERVNLVYAIKVVVPNDGSLKIGMPGEIIF